MFASSRRNRKLRPSKTSKRKARHLAEADQARRWRRKVLGLPVAAWLIGLTTTAVALVGYLLLFGASGTLTSSEGLNVEITAVSGLNHSTSAGAATCVITEPSPDELDLQIGDFDPGDVCRFIITLDNLSATNTAQIEGFLTESVDWAGGEIRVEIGNCGQGIPAGGFVDTQVWFTGESTLTPSQTFTFDRSVDGLSVVPDGTADPGKCVEYTP